MTYQPQKQRRGKQNTIKKVLAIGFFGISCAFTGSYFDVHRQYFLRPYHFVIGAHGAKDGAYPLDYRITFDMQEKRELRAYVTNVKTNKKVPLYANGKTSHFSQDVHSFMDDISQCFEEIDWQKQQNIVKEKFSRAMDSFSSLFSEDKK